MSGLPRDVLKWLQSLDLTHPVKNVKRDLSNGYLIAEIFSWYYPKEIEMHMFRNGKSLETKVGNWSQLQTFFTRHMIDIPREIVAGTMHCKPEAAHLLIERVYSVLTNRKIHDFPSDYEVDFSDSVYQNQLPLHARSTASQAIKNNLANTELSTDPDSILCRQKAQGIIRQHLEHRKQQRIQDPRRFGIKPTLGQLSPRRPPPMRQEIRESTVQNENTQIPQPEPGEAQAFQETKENTIESLPESFKEVVVTQSHRGRTESNYSYTH